MAVQVISGTTSGSMSFTEVATLAFNTSSQFQVQVPGGALAFTFANATGGALNVDTMYAHQYTLASTTQAIDLFGGSLLSPAGNACVFARVRLFHVDVVTTGAGKLIEVYGSASNAPAWLPLVATYLWATPSGGSITLIDPSEITTAGYLVSTSAKAITFNSASNTVTFNVLIVGNSSAS